MTVREILTTRLRAEEVLHIAAPNSINEEFSHEEKVKFIHGHINITQVEHLSPKREVYTFLRDPLERAISEYNFIKGSNYLISDLPPEQAELIEKIKSTSLDDYLTSTQKGIRGRVQNTQLFYLSGDVFNPNLSLSERFEIACKTLDDCKFVGIVEEMDDSIALLAIIEQLPPSTPAIRNPSQREHKPISPDAVEIFKERNEYEYKIYEYAKDKMRSDLQRLTRELSLRSYLNSLRERPSLDALRYTFDMPLEGDGWHTRETNGSVYWRFTGPTSRASLYFPRMSHSVRTITFQVVHAITPVHFSQLKVLLNGHDLGSGSHEGMQVRFSIPAAFLEAPYTCIEIITPPPQKPEAGDNRKLGIAFSAIEIE